MAHDLGELLAGIREVTGDTPLTGCTTSGHFYDGVLVHPGGGVVVVVMTAGPYRFGVASVTGIGADGAGAGSLLARQARAAAGEEPSPHACLLLFADGMCGAHQPLIGGIYRVVGAGVPVVGGAAGDDQALTRTCVFHDDQVLDDAAVGVWIASERPVVVAARHGWQADGAPLLVTKVEGTVLAELGGRPVMEVLREHLPTPDDFLLGTGERGGVSIARGFGLIEPDGSLLVRGAHIEDGTIHTFESLPLYAAVQVVSCTKEDVLAVTGEVVEIVTAGHEPSLVLAFSCIARLELLGEQAVEEIGRLQEAAGSARTVGFYTYGEFARTTSVSGVHNVTLAAVAL
ncbi:MAG: hypothetical protein GXX79_00550 [Actinomycetales bacterium]|nr:hypothetical protein [Actinomycetales bacterium]